MKGFPKLRVYDPGQKAMGGKSNMVYLKSVEQMDDGVYLRFERHLEDDENLKYMWGTGIKDKNAKEVFEGDIVKCGRYGLVGEIVTIERRGTGLYPITNKRRQKNWKSVMDGKVIGNKYENPELLEVQEDDNDL